MEGPFKIIFKDYFGFEHETIIWAQTTRGAIRRFEKQRDYPFEIISVALDYDAILNAPYSST